MGVCPVDGKLPSFLFLPVVFFMSMNSFLLHIYAKCACFIKKSRKNLQNSKIMLTFAPAIQLEQ